MASCGTPEGFRAHKRAEQEPCPACKAAMGQLLQRVRAFRAQVAGTMPYVPPLPAFSAHQRTLWPQRREAERAAEYAEHPPPPPLPAPSLPRVRCVGDEPFLPSSPKSVAKKAAAKGWWVSITRAIGPRINAMGLVPEGREQVATIAVAAARGDDRLTWLWHYIEKTKDGILGWHWELDEVYSNKEGVINDKRGRAVLDG